MWRMSAILLVAMLGATSSAPAAGAPAGKIRKAGRGADSVLVRIGNEAITASMVQNRIDELPEQARSSYLTPEGRQRLLERMVEERVWLISALRQHVEARPEIKRQLEQQRRDLLIRTHINEVMAANPAPSDSDARVFYDAHLSDYRVPATATLSHIQSRSESEARRVKQWARGGQDWKKLAARYSADTLTRNTGGLLGSVTREGMFSGLGRQPALAESAFGLGEGKLGGPYRTDRGWHVIRVETLKPEDTRPFEQMRGNIVRQLGSKRSQEFYQARLTEAKTALGVKADSNAIRVYVSQKKTAREVFNEAQALGAPVARLEAYRRLLQEHPSSDVGPQAQFMIGFIHSEELKDYESAERAFRDLLERYPGSELVASARWMIEHMRTEGAPGFMNLESDSIGTAHGTKAEKDAPGKP